MTADRPFAVAQLGYLVFEVSNLAAWEACATGVLGLGLARRSDTGAMGFRMDDHAERLLIEPGPADDLAAVGWEVESAGALGALVERLASRGVFVRDGTPEEAARRRVSHLVCFKDPAGIPSELYHGPELASEPFTSEVVRGGFVAGGLGSGHVVLSTEDQEESERFYRELLGFRPSDRIKCEYYGHAVDIAFFHVNGRHHTLALGARQPRRLHHFLVEARSVDDVGLALDRTLAAGLRVMQTLGRHPNDRMLSFYALTPSGFQFEFGWGGRLVDDETWVATTYDRISEWGHHPPQVLVPKPRSKEPRP